MAALRSRNRGGNARVVARIEPIYRCGDRGKVLRGRPVEHVGRAQIVAHGGKLKRLASTPAETRSPPVCRWPPAVSGRNRPWRSGQQSLPRDRASTQLSRAHPGPGYDSLSPPFGPVPESRSGTTTTYPCAARSSAMLRTQSLSPKISCTISSTGALLFTSG